jgi:D-threo-aldose 1-dehydrogenase
VNSHAIGGTGVRVTELGFGTAPIGNLYHAVSDETAAVAVHAAWAGGVRYFDTAPHYGLGLAERRLAAALSGYPRAEYAVSTKVGRLLVPNPRPSGSDLEAGFAVADDLTRQRDYSADGVRRSIEASLQRLGIDRIDIALVHDPDDHMDQAVTEAIPALVALREAGVVSAVGVGMNFWQPLSRFVTETDIDVILVAGRWTLADRSAEPLLDLCAPRGISVLAAAPFNSGLLASAAPNEKGLFDYGSASAQWLGLARELAAVATERGTSLPHAALRHPLRHPAVVSVVAGIRSASEAEANTRWINANLPESTWRALDAIEASARQG